jgi:hypothetical protein
MIAPAVQPGFHLQMPDADYRELDAISASDLRKCYLGEDKPTPGSIERMAMGTAFHEQVQYGEVRSAHWVDMPVVEEATTSGTKYAGLNTKEGKAAWDEATAEMPKGKNPIRIQNQPEVIHGFSNWVKENPDLSRMRSYCQQNPKRVEVSMVWGADELAYKGRIDLVGETRLFDLKTTGCTTLEQWLGSAWLKYDYGIQAAMYLWGFNLLAKNPINTFTFVVCSKPTRQVWIVDCPKHVLEHGLREVHARSRYYQLLKETL